MLMKLLILQLESFARSMIKKILLLIVISLGISNLFAQRNTDFFSGVEKQSESGGVVKINQKQEIFQATNDHIYFIRNRKGVDRYRIWIFTGNKIELDKARARFVREFPEYEIHNSYIAPDFYMFVGDFYRRNEAKRALKEIKKVFPNAFDRIFYGEIENDYLKHTVKVNK